MQNRPGPKGLSHSAGTRSGADFSFNIDTKGHGSVCVHVCMSVCGTYMVGGVHELDTNAARSFKHNELDCHGRVDKYLHMDCHKEATLNVG